MTTTEYRPSLADVRALSVDRRDAETAEVVGVVAWLEQHLVDPRTSDDVAMPDYGDGELTLAGESQVVALDNGTIREFTVTPEDAGLGRADVAAVKGGDAAHNAAALVALLQGAHGAYRDVVTLNAGAGLVVAGKAGDLREGATLAAQAIDSGAALDILHRLRRACPPKDSSS